MDLFWLISMFLIALSSFGTTLFFIYKGIYKNKIEGKWATFSLLFIGIWSLGRFFFGLCTTKQAAFLWVKVSYFGSIGIPLFFLGFVNFYIGKNKKKSPFLKICFLFAVLLWVLNLTSYFIADLIPKMHFKFFDVAGGAYFLFILFYSIFIPVGFYDLFKELGVSKGSRKNQIKYLATAYGLGFIGASTAFLLVYDFPIYPFGIIFIPTFPLILGYAIITEHLLDIEVVIRRSLVFAGLFAAIVIVYATPLLLFQNIFQQTFRISQGISITIVIIAIIFGYERLKKFLINTTDKFLFQKQYEYRQALMDLSKGMAQLLPLKTFLYLLVKNIVEIVRIEGGAGVVLNEHSEKYQVLTARGSFWKNLKDREFSKDCLIASALENKSYLLKEEITDKRLKEEMEKLRIHFIIPSYFENKIIGFLILGEKKSQESYSLEDIDLFLTLAPQVAVSIQNCKLYGTEREKREVAEEKVEIAQQEIERSSRLAALGTLAAGLAHEIRNPMTILRSRAEDLISEINNKQYLLEYSELSIKNIDRILKIVNNMLRFARTKETGQMPLEIDEVLNDTLTLLSSKIKNKGIQVIKEFRCGQKITGDANSLQQAFLNILLNSLDFMNEGGTLTIKTQLAGSEITIEISDTGHGIEEGNLERIFDPFYSTRSEGTGLGLAITYRIIQDQGGKIKVESQVGKGTRFLISLPAG